jgi:hypothetical protein
MSMLDPSERSSVVRSGPNRAPSPDKDRVHFATRSLRPRMKPR